MQRKSTIKFADDDDDILEEEDRQRRVSVIASRRQSVVIAGSTGVLRRTSMFLSRTSQSGHRSSLQSNESSILKSSLKSSLKASPRSPAVKPAGVAAATTVIYQKQATKQSPISKIKKKAPKPVTGVTNVAFKNESENHIVVDDDIDDVIDDVFVAPKPRLTIPSLIEEETSVRSSNRTTNRNTQQETDDVTKRPDDVNRETLEEIHEVGNEDVFDAANVKTLFGMKPGEISSSDVTMTSSNHSQPTSQQQNNAFVYPQLDQSSISTPTDQSEHISGEKVVSQPVGTSDPPRKPSIHGIKLPSIKNDVPPVAIKTGFLLGSASNTEGAKTEIEGLQEFQEQLKNGNLPKVQEELSFDKEIDQKKEKKSKKKKRKKAVPPEDNPQGQEGLQNLQNGIEDHLQEQPSSLESIKSHQSNEEKSSRKKKRRKSQKMSTDLQATSSAASISPEDQQRLEEIYNRALEEQNFENPSEGTV